VIRAYANLPASMGTVYAIAQNANGEYWTGSYYEVSPTWANAVLTTTRNGERLYVDVPDDAASVDFRLQVGGSPASTDPAVWFDAPVRATDSNGAALATAAAVAAVQTAVDAIEGGLTPQQSEKLDDIHTNMQGRGA
jgi:hypothetical protein